MRATRLRYAPIREHVEGPILLRGASPKASLTGMNHVFATRRLPQMLSEKFIRDGDRHEHACCRPAPSRFLYVRQRAESAWESTSAITLNLCPALPEKAHILVHGDGFEPPTPWASTKCSTN